MFDLQVGPCSSPCCSVEELQPELLRDQTLTSRTFSSPDCSSYSVSIIHQKENYIFGVQKVVFYRSNAN